MTEFEKTVLKELRGIQSQLKENTEITKAIKHQQEVQAATIHDIKHTVSKIEGVLTGQAQLALKALKVKKI